VPLGKYMEEDLSFVRGTELESTGPPPYTCQDVVG
jgi:hypothetical protein